MIRGLHLCTDSYSAWIDACEDRVRRGVVQRYCPGCGKWRWDDEACEGCPEAMRSRRMTRAKFDAMIEEVARDVRRPREED